MLYLQSHDAFGGVARLSAPDAPIEILAKSQSDEARSAPKSGLCATVDGRIVCLFRADGVLWLRIDDRSLPVDDSVTVEWDLLRTERGAIRATFRVERAGETQWAFEYRPFQNRKLIPGDMTPFIDEEDYDYLLLVSRVIGDRGRRERFFAQPVAL